MRDFILNNFKWKLVALSLAMIVWFTIKNASWSGMSPDPFGLGDRTASVDVPVLAVVAPDDQRTFVITPKTVTVRLRMKQAMLDLDPVSGTMAYVDLSELPDLTEISRLREVLVRVPSDMEVIRVDPQWVSVEHSRLLGTSLTNTLINP